MAQCPPPPPYASASGNTDGQHDTLRLSFGDANWRACRECN